MSETPIGDQVAEELGVVTPEQETISMTDPYRIPGEDDPDDPDAATATEGDELAEQSDNSGEPETDEVPQEPGAVQDNANDLDGDEIDGDEPAPDGEE